jgi:hypothetical protein
MDHHCPWVANCVGYGNYKFFFLLLVHGFFATFTAQTVWMPLALGLWAPYVPNVVGLVDGAGSGSAVPERDVMIANRDLVLSHGGMKSIFGFALCISLMFALTGLGGVHVYLVLRGKTTLEGAETG